LRGGAMWAHGWFEFVPVFHLRAVFFGLGLIGLWSCLRAWRAERERLLLVMFASIAISAPFLFPYGGSRILAATFPVDALIVARGVIHLTGQAFVAIRMWNGRVPLDVLVAGSIAVAPLPIAMVLRAAPLYSPLIADVECSAEQRPFVADLEHTSVAVTLGAAGQTSIFPLVVDRERFSKLIHPDTNQLEKLQSLPAGTTLFEVMQRLPRSGSNAYGSPMPFLWTGPVPKGVVKACIDVSPDLWLPVATSLTPIGR
ncbi:MAG: hypothetical protein VW600_14495, partial [Ferrovibrio sp.]